MAAGIIDPTKVLSATMALLSSSLFHGVAPEPHIVVVFVVVQVVRCCLEHAASVAKTFLTSDVVVVEIKEAETAAAGSPMDNSGIYISPLPDICALYMRSRK